LDEIETKSRDQEKNETDLDKNVGKTKTKFRSKEKNRQDLDSLERA
jgi:hypothetical protein